MMHSKCRVILESTIELSASFLEKLEPFTKILNGNSYIVDKYDKLIFIQIPPARPGLITISLAYLLKHLFESDAN